MLLARRYFVIFFHCTEGEFVIPDVISCSAVVFNKDATEMTDEVFSQLYDVRRLWFGKANPLFN